MRNEFAVYILHDAINANDASIPIALNNLFHQLQLAGINYPTLDNEGVIEFTASLAECIQAGVDKKKLHAEVDKLANSEIPSKDYYAISYLVPKRQQPTA